MNKEKQKEKINWKFVFAVSIPVTIVISIVSRFIIPIIADNTKHNYGRRFKRRSTSK